MDVMRRHTTSLYTHSGLADLQEEEEEFEPEVSWLSSSQSVRPPPFAAVSTPSVPSRLRDSRYASSSPAGSSSSVNSVPTNSSTSGGDRPSYAKSNFYLSFLRRYQTRPDGDPRDDPDSHFHQRGLGQLLDGGESDDEDLGRVELGLSDGHDRFSSLVLETDTIEPETLEDRERLEWQTMLASVLAGDVLRSEKSRIASVLARSSNEMKNLRLNLWYGIRAHMRGRKEADERRFVDEGRAATVDPVINEILTFRAKSAESSSDPGAAALAQVNEVIHHLDVVQTLYPALRALEEDKPVIGRDTFADRRDTLITWSNVFTSLRHQIEVLRKWTGSETLDVTAPNPNSDGPLGLRYSRGGAGPAPDGTTFLERVLKEESIQMTFAKGFMTTVHSLIAKARDTQVNRAALIKEMNLPFFERELTPLISFPTQLALASLQVLLGYAQKLKDPEVLIIDQMTEDLKLNIGIACTLKRQYEAFLSPDPGGNWNLPHCISKDYDSVILDALLFIFKLLHWKLKSGAKDIYFKETDVIEAQWPIFNDVALTVSGGASVVAEQLCGLTNRLMVRVTNFFETQVRVPLSERSDLRLKGLVNGVVLNGSPALRTGMTDQQMVSWYHKILESVRLRYRKLQRFVRGINQRLANSAEYSLEAVSLELFIERLVETDHFLVLTRTFEEEGIYIVASQSLCTHPEYVRKIILEAFHVTEEDEDQEVTNIYNFDAGDASVSGYILVLSPQERFLWSGRVLVLDIPKIHLDLKDNRVRLIADGAKHRLLLAKSDFMESFLLADEDGLPTDTCMRPPVCVAEQQAHLPSVNRQLRKIGGATNRLAESIVDSVHHVRYALQGAEKRQALLESWYSFASEHGLHVQKYMDRTTLQKFNRLLIKLAISWVSFICDDCDPNDRQTFRWAVNALEFALGRTRQNNILQLPDDQFEMLRQKVASCMTLLISHFDILGARSTIEEHKEKERQEGLLRQPSKDLSLTHDSELLRSLSIDASQAAGGYIDPSFAKFWERTTRALESLEQDRASITSEQRMSGRVLDDEKLEDRSVVFLASFSSNISIRWQQGRFIGAGAFGSVYLAVNLDSGSLMAVKEIKFQDLAGLPSLYSQIRDELRVMEMLHHPNIVEYYGIEVHRDKVYIFEEYCQGGNLATLLEHGRIEDEGIIQIYTMQMLEGLTYLHSKGIVHRDIKPDNILLDHRGVLKFVDFGAAKIFARNQRSFAARSRRMAESGFDNTDVANSLTGTPMYMSPEMIKNDKKGRYGAMDIWSMGCVVLEAIMFHIGVTTQHPPLPEPDQLSALGINFIKECLTVDAMKRPSARELQDHPWMLEFRQALFNYEEEELATSPPTEMPPEEPYEQASVARQAAIIQEKEVEAIQAPSPGESPSRTPPQVDTPIPDIERPT
ncbi:kinase [Vararia minispora EC-137]|uniref:Kinase n=1 Tax=Vararia minispora EC-137 TaxID=1314806 RepID=A0ACB8QLN1_9AGAM|nr:kinase [Vararia minispora EC-137]